jgi:hypothetical protein
VLVIWAQTRSTLAAVAALRETSVIVAAGIGAVYLDSGSEEQRGRIHRHAEARRAPYLHDPEACA